MSRSEKDRLGDINEAIVAIRKHLANVDEQLSGENAALLHDALLFQYFRIEIDRVLAIVKHDLSPLEQAIERLLGE